MTAALFEIDALEAGYQRPVIGPLSFTLQTSEVVGIWGPNGSGKSTLLRALAGSARVFAGHIERAPGIKLAYQQQHPVRLPEMPIRGSEFLRFMHAQRERPPARLAALLDKRVDRLSGGQFQLLCIWACLAGDADVVLLDEPTNNIDPVSMSILREILHDGPAGRSVLVVSHERDFLAAACSRVLEVG
jgi:zinc transport system ATP-binding protein